MSKNIFENGHPHHTPIPSIPPCPPCHPFPHGMKGTENYQLPQWDAQTVTSWMTQLNYAMFRIDQVMHGLALRTGIDGVSEELIKDVEKLNEEYNKIACKLAEVNNNLYDNNAQQASIQTQLTNLATQVQTLTTNLVNVDTRLSTVESKAENIQLQLTKTMENLNQLSTDVTGVSDALEELALRVQALEEKSE